MGENIFNKLCSGCSHVTRVWRRRCYCKDDASTDLFDADEAEEARRKEMEKSIKQTAMQKTSARMRAKFTKNLNAKADLLLYYLTTLLEPEHEGEDVNMTFVEDLLKEECDINLNNDNLENPLFLAIKLDSEKLVEYLLEKNVNISGKNKDGLSVFHFVANHDSVNILKLLVDKFEASGIKLKDYIDGKSNKELQTPLHKTAMFGAKAVAESLISDYGVNTEAIDYKSRTPLYIAAEYNRKEMVSTFMNLKCNVAYKDSNKSDVLSNDKGQTALYWIVTKMPDIATDALDQLYEPNSYLRKDKYYLTALEPTIMRRRSNEPKIVLKTVLSSIVESENLDLIVHPVISNLIDVKWRTFARLNAWIELLVSVIYVGVWVTFALWVPWNLKYDYDWINSNLDRFRFSLFIIGIFFTIYLIVAELFEVASDYKFIKKCNNMRLKELDNYKDDAGFVEEEKSQLRDTSKFEFLIDYITDPWNIYDWISIVLLLGCIVTHIADISNHTLYMALTHIRIMSFTIIIISFRLLKSSRVVFQNFGYIVMIIYYALSDIVVWIFLYIIIWVSFCCSFYMIFGGTQFSNDSVQNSNCTDVTNSEFNCTTVKVTSFTSFDIGLYSLYRATFGNSLDETNMGLVDDIMTNILIGTFLGFTALVLVNIFIAILTNTVNRVWEKAVAYVILQRACVIVSQEKGWSYDQHKDHVKYLTENCCPYIDEIYNEAVSSTGDKIDNLHDEIKEQKNAFKEMSSSLDEANDAIKNQTKTKSKKIKNLIAEVSQLKEVMLNFMNAQANILNEREIHMQQNKPAQFDYLHVSEFTSPTDVNIS